MYNAKFKIMEHVNGNTCDRLKLHISGSDFSFERIVLSNLWNKCQKVSEFAQEIPQSHTADKSTAS